MMSLLVRLVIVVISFLLSSVVGATVFFCLKQEKSWEALLALDPKIYLYGVGGYLLEGIKMLLAGGYMVLLPVLVGIVVGFLLRIRTIFYYVPAGGLAIFMIPVLVGFSTTSAFEQPDDTSTFLYLVSGAAAGFSYWLIGGANAVPKRGTSFF